jgi:hypothetical protein
VTEMQHDKKLKFTLIKPADPGTSFARRFVYSVILSNTPWTP